MPYTLHNKSEILKGGILGSRTLDIFYENSGHFWFRPMIFYNSNDVPEAIIDLSIQMDLIGA